MKKLSFLTLAAAGMLLAACSSSNDSVTESPNEYKFVEGEKSYLSIGLATPGEGVTRDNDDLDDGEESEFKVYDGQLVLFKGTSESTATLVKAYDISNYVKKNIGDEGADWNNETGDNVPTGSTAGEITSTTKRIVVAIDNPTLASGQHLFAYVILNCKENSGAEPSNTPGQTFAEYSRQILNNIGELTSDKGLVMTNVPICDKSGGSVAPESGAKITTLAEIPANCVYDTEAKANADDKAACIYVERAAAKIHVVLNSTAPKDPTRPSVALAASDISWALGNTNTTYFNTRQMSEDWLPLFNAKATGSVKYRFVGETKFFDATTHNTAYRTYWGEDVNYSKNVDDAGVTALTNTKVTDYNKNIDDKVYVAENTFDEDHQYYKNTTFVGVKIKLNGGDAFFTVSSEPDKNLDKTGAENKIKEDINVALRGEFISTLDSRITTALADAESDLRKAPSSVPADATIEYTFTHNFVWGGSRNTTDGSWSWTDHFTLTNVKVNGVAATSDQQTAIENLAKADPKNLLAEISTMTDLSTLKAYEYVGGYAYYTVRVAHFGDTETPWDADPTDANLYDKIYPSSGTNPLITGAFGTSRANAWLGRWGVVRNNWYKLSIDEVHGIGSAEPEDFGGSSTNGTTPDDNPKPKYYIAAHIHILPWVLRTQSVKF